MHEYKIDHPASDPVDHTHDLCIGGQCYEIGAIDHEWDFGPTLSVDYFFFIPAGILVLWNSCTVILLALMLTVLV
jgi:hypothetical protein